MNQQDKNIFDDNFNIYINKLAKIYKLKFLTDQQVNEIEKGNKHPELPNGHFISKNYHYNLFFRRVDKLISLGYNIHPGNSKNFINRLKNNTN